MNKTFALIHSFTSLVVSMVAMCIYVHVGHVRIEFVVLEIELTHVRYCYCETKVRSSSVRV